jgi:uncharacterized repeat protein (TIGR01451 family)
VSNVAWTQANFGCGSAQNSSSAAFTLGTPLAVSLVKSVTPSSAKAGEAVRYLVTVRNTGAATVTSVLVTDTLPAEVIFSGEDHALVFSFARNGNLLSWNAPALTLNPGGALTVTVTGTVANGANGTVTNTAWVKTADGCGSVQGAGSASFTATKKKGNTAVAATDAVGPEGVKIVGGVRGYINPKNGESATFLVRPSSAGEIHIRIFNEEGMLVQELKQTTNGGHTETLQWNATDSSGKTVVPGLYPVLVEGPGIRYRDRLVVIR